MVSIKDFSTLLKIYNPKIKITIEKNKLNKVNPKLKSELENNTYLKFSITELTGLRI